MSKFKLTLDEFKPGDYTTTVNGLEILYREDVSQHIHRLQIIYENNRLGLKDTATS